MSGNELASNFTPMPIGFAIANARRAFAGLTATLRKGAPGLSCAVTPKLTSPAPGGNAFVPLAGMPAVVKTIAEWNPVSTLVLACRELFGNPTGIQQDLPGAPWSLQHPEAYTLISCVLVIAVFSVLAVRKYRRTTG